MAAAAISCDYTKNSVEADRALAKVVTVTKIEPIPKAEKIELTTVLGWKCITKKGEFKVGDMCIYLQVDAVADPKDRDLAFLQGKRIKTQTKFDVLSQGVLCPMAWLLGRVRDNGKEVTEVKDVKDVKDFKEGDDVTKLMGIRKYVMTAELSQYQGGAHTFPSFVRMTEEERLQNVPKIISELSGKQVVITRKEDGTSTTFIYLKTKGQEKEKEKEKENEKGDENGRFIVCGRTKVLQRGVKQDAHYWEMCDKFKIEDGMKKLGLNIAIQGETVGPKINKGRLGIKGNDFRVFNVFDIDAQCYMTWERVEEICGKLGLNMVPVIYKGLFKEEWASVDALLKIANELKYSNEVPAEGIVVKTNYGKDHPRHSFKVLSNVYK